jgi:hypothetical protein
MHDRRRLRQTGLDPEAATTCHRKNLFGKKYHGHEFFTKDDYFLGVAAGLGLNSKGEVNAKTHC